MTQGNLDSQVIAQSELDCYINQQVNQIAPSEEDLLDRPFDELMPSEWEQLKQYQPEIGIDSILDMLGTLYRVWHGMKLLGSFYQAIDDNWISQPCNTTEHGCWLTDTEAIASITA